MSPSPSGATLVAGVAGSPVDHSLSPTLHNSWIRAAGIDAVYVAFRPGADRFTAFAEGLRGGVIRGLNVTAPFKHDALALADAVSGRARRAGSANLLIFETDGSIAADNTDGLGLLIAFRQQAPGFDPAAGPVVILGAGGAARGAVAAFLDAGAPEVRVVNRHEGRARTLTEVFGPRVRAFGPADVRPAMADAAALVNATPQGRDDGAAPDVPLDALPDAAVVMDMVYHPLRTRLLKGAAIRGLRTVDGLAMLIGQAEPSFEAFFGRPPPPLDIRRIVLDLLEKR